MPTDPRPMRLVEGGDSLPSQQFVPLKILQARLGFIGIGAHFGWSGTPIFSWANMGGYAYTTPLCPSVQWGDRRLIVAACHATMGRMRRGAHIYYQTFD